MLDVSPPTVHELVRSKGLAILHELLDLKAEAPQHLDGRFTGDKFVDHEAALA